MARLSPFVNTNLGVHGIYSFVLPDVGPGVIAVARPGKHRRGRRGVNTSGLYDDTATAVRSS